MLLLLPILTTAASTTMNLDEQLIEQDTNMAGVESEGEDSSDILDGQEQEQEELGEQQRSFEIQWAIFMEYRL